MTNKRLTIDDFTIVFAIVVIIMCLITGWIVNMQMIAKDAIINDLNETIKTKNEKLLAAWNAQDMLKQSLNGNSNISLFTQEELDTTCSQRSEFEMNYLVTEGEDICNLMRHQFDLISSEDINLEYYYQIRNRCAAFR